MMSANLLIYTSFLLGIFSFTTLQSQPITFFSPESFDSFTTDIQESDPIQEGDYEVIDMLSVQISTNDFSCPGGTIHILTLDNETQWILNAEIDTYKSIRMDLAQPISIFYDEELDLYLLEMPQLNNKDPILKNFQRIDQSTVLYESPTRICSAIRFDYQQIIEVERLSKEDCNGFEGSIYHLSDGSEWIRSDWENSILVREEDEFVTYDRSRQIGSWVIIGYSETGKNNFWIENQQLIKLNLDLFHFDEENSFELRKDNRHYSEDGWYYLLLNEAAEDCLP